MLLSNLNKRQVDINQNRKLTPHPTVWLLSGIDLDNTFLIGTRIQYLTCPKLLSKLTLAEGLGTEKNLNNVILRHSDVLQPKSRITTFRFTWITASIRRYFMSWAKPWVCWFLLRQIIILLNHEWVFQCRNF